MADVANSVASSEQFQQNEPRNEAVPESLKVWPCGCDEVLDPHLEDFAVFQRHVRDGLKNLKSQDVRYDCIEVLMVYWKGGDVPEVAENAKRLGALFQEQPYNFLVTPYEVDYKNLSQEQIDDGLDDALTKIRERLRTKENEKDNSNLLILYYGGHGVEHYADRLWKPRKKSEKHIIWSNYQSRMYNFTCDILYLFDCCHSKAMVETTSTTSLHRRRCEIFCSSGLKESSGALSKDNFTGALTDYLTQKRDDVLSKKDAIGGLTFESICDRMTKKDIRDKLIAEPRWNPVSPNPAFRGRITMAKNDSEIATSQSQQDDSDSGYESMVNSRSQLSDTRILIKLRLTNPAEGLSADDWLKWFEQRPHNVAHVDIAVVKIIEWVGIFESDSSLALITVPLWLWYNMEHDPACESLGIVRSENLLQRPPGGAQPGNVLPEKVQPKGLPLPVEQTSDKASLQSDVKGKSVSLVTRDAPNNTAFKFPSRIDFEYARNTRVTITPKQKIKAADDPVPKTTSIKRSPSMAKIRTTIKSLFLPQPSTLLPDSHFNTAVAHRLRHVPETILT
jgi:hypothetical protein